MEILNEMKQILQKQPPTEPASNPLFPLSPAAVRALLAMSTEQAA